MTTLTPVRTCHHATIRLQSGQATGFIDLTDDLHSLVIDANVRTGLLNVQTAHTTTALVVNEHEPLLLSDFQAFLERVAPRSAIYAHDDMSRRGEVAPGEPANGHAHCRALLLPTSACLNIIDGRLALGRWQRVFLVELDGPRERTASVVIVGEVVS